MCLGLNELYSVDCGLKAKGHVHGYSSLSFPGARYCPKQLTCINAFLQQQVILVCLRLSN